MKPLQKKSIVSSYLGFYTCPNTMEDDEAGKHNKEIFEQLDRAVSGGDVQAFEKILNTESIYSPTLKFIQRDYYYDAHEQTGYADYQRLETNILADLFFFDRQKLIGICQKILETNSHRLYQSLMKEFKEIGIVPESLFYLDSNMLDNMGKSIRDLRHHADQAEPDRAELLAGIAEDLNHKLSAHLDFEESEHAALSSAFKLNLTRFIFKLVSLEAVHKHDSTLAKDPNWKKFALNLASVLFTAGVANLINRVLTGKWAISVDTNTQKKIKNIETEIDNDAGHHKLHRQLK